MTEIIPLPEWIFNEYVKHLKLSSMEGDYRYKEFIKLNKQYLILSGIMRANAFINLKYGYPLRRSGYTMASLSVKMNENYSHYGCIYWSKQDGSIILDPEYVCTSATVDSRDGEYRHRFIWYPLFVTTYDSISSILSEIEECVLNLVIEGKLNLHAFIFPSDNVQLYVNNINERRLLIKMFCVCLISDNINVYGGKCPDHLNASYRSILTDIVPYIKHLLDPLNTSDFLSKLCGFRSGSTQSGNRLQCGQKITPLSMRAAVQVEDINFGIWREIYVNRLCSDLVINGICPCFPLYNQWTYITGSTAELFENISMKEKYENASVAKLATEHLMAARKIMSTNKVFDQFGERALHAIEYAESFLHMSPISIVSTTEWVGLTLKTYPAYIRKSEIPNPVYNELFNDIDIFASALFGFCYGCHILHTRGNVIHADLHLNNMTILWFTPLWVRSVGDPYKKRTEINPVIAYILSDKGEMDTYILKHIEGYSCIIDFSRSIIGKKTDIELSKGELFAKNFYNNQIGRIIQTLQQYIPKFMDVHLNKIKALLLGGDYQAIFATMTGIDYFAIGHNIRMLLQEEYHEENNDRRSLQISNQVIDMCTKLEEGALSFLTSNLQKLIDDTECNEIEFAGVQLIKNIFSKYKFQNLSDEQLMNYTVIDVYNGANEITYSGNNYNTYPPWTQSETLTKHSGGKCMDELLARGDRPLAAIDQHNLQFDNLISEMRNFLVTD